MSNTSPRRLSSRNPLDHLRLLWWMLAAPQQLQAYRDAFEEQDERHVGRWLTSTLIWLPLAIPTLALALEIWPHTPRTLSPTFYVGSLVGLGLAWMFTGWLGTVDVAEGPAGSAPTGRKQMMLLSIALALVCGVTLAIGGGIADAWEQASVFVAVACICIVESVAFVAADVVVKGSDTGVLGSIEGFAALGVVGFLSVSAAEGLRNALVNLVVAGMSIGAGLGVSERVQDSLRDGRASWSARIALGALTLALFFLFWLSMIGR
ncbi:MAG TPA: hypothetical protein ENN99_13615 [Chloroflexi bacterium]|nr:hypothetical protein [Chloroflexota bacterium]